MNYVIIDYTIFNTFLFTYNWTVFYIKKILNFFNKTSIDYNIQHKHSNSDEFRWLPLTKNSLTDKHTSYPQSFMSPRTSTFFFYYSWTVTSLNKKNENDCIILFSKSFDYFVPYFATVHLFFFNFRVINLTRLIFEILALLFLRHCS